MPVQCVETVAGTGLMFDNDGRTVIKGGTVVIKAVHLAVQRGIDPASSRHIQVKAQMNGPGFGHFIGLNLKLPGRINQAGLIVAPHPDPGNG